MAKKSDKKKKQKKGFEPQEHEQEFLNWDFVPQFPHQPGEHGLPLDLEAEAADVQIESICGGVDDSQPVEQYDGALGVTVAFVNAHQAPVGQLQWNSNLASIYTNPGNVSGVRWCTGTMISDDLFLTAGHCFDQNGGGWSRPLINGTSTVIPPSEIATNMHVNFNYQVNASGVLQAEDSFAVLELMEYRLDGLDFAVARLAGAPGTIYGKTKISASDANTGDMLCIIQHPAGLPKRIEAGPATDLHDTRIGYNSLDTLGGSSGAGILGPNGRIVGVHTNGGCTSSAVGHNHGQRIESVIASSPIVAGLVSLKLKVIDDGVKLKAIDDVLKFKFHDDKLKVLDDKLKFFDDVKAPFFDVAKISAFDQPFRPGFGNLFGPRAGGQAAGGQGGGGAPFVLRTPHHAQPAGGGAQTSAAGGGEREQYEAALAQLEAAIQAGSAQLEQLDGQYRQLREQYEERGGRS